MRLFKLQMLITLTLIITSSCNHLTDKTLEKDAQITLPEIFSSGSKASITRHNWWQELPFKDLNNFINKAVNENLSIKQARYRLEQIKALSMQVGAKQYPSLGITTRAKTTKIENEVTDSTSIDEYSLGIAASYEIDLWNKISAQKKASILNIKSSEKELETITITLSARIAEIWVNIIAQMQNIKQLRSLKKINESLLATVQTRYLNGEASSIDYLRQLKIVTNIKAQIPLSKETETLLRNELNILQGSSPDRKILIPEIVIPPLPAFPETGLPVDLLHNRPDIKSSYLKLKAEIQNLYSAKANRMPSLKIDASLIFAATTLSNLFDNWISSLIGGIITPLIDGNLRKAEIEKMKLLVKQKVTEYRLSILTALKEVEDAISKEHFKTINLHEFEKELQTAKQSLQLAILRYQKGEATYLMVATNLIELKNMEIILIQKKRNLWVARIALHRALGGNLK